MKNKYTLLIPVIIYFMISANLFITGCTKEGPPGPPGLDGKDAAENCMACHNFSDFIVGKFTQYAHSIHASGNNISRNGDNCAHCHTGQGFRAFIADGVMQQVDNPTAINCRTCHPIHETYTVDDYAVRAISPVNLIVSNAVYDYGNSNICANCHQGRAVSPYPVAGGDEITITNARYGPHYGPQSNMIVGEGPYKVSGSMAYENSAHSNLISDGCITCHMAPAIGYDAGGHQMNLSFEMASGQTGYNLNGCTDCHTNSANLSALLAENREEIKALTYELRDKLIEKGLLNQAELVPTPITVSPDEAGAIMNYKFVYGDNSYGAHNYLFTKALLVNTLESLD